MSTNTTIFNKLDDILRCTLTIYTWYMRLFYLHGSKSQDHVSSIKLDENSLKHFILCVSSVANMVSFFFWGRRNSPKLYICINLLSFSIKLL